MGRHLLNLVEWRISTKFNFLSPPRDWQQQNKKSSADITMFDSDGKEYCFINVGRAGGKLKFCMLDKDKRYIGDQYHLKSVMLDSAGTTPSIHVLAFPRSDSQPGVDTSLVTTLQRLVWQLHHSKKPSSGQTVGHKNGNTMDNRVDNLTLCEGNITPDLCSDNGEIIFSDDVTSSIYTSCISQLVPDMSQLNVPESLHIPTALETSIVSRCSSLVQANQNSCNKLIPVDLTNRVPKYYECHYLPCTNIEQNHLEYQSCGGCLSVRYCSLECQGLDWPAHKGHCDTIQLLQTFGSFPTSNILVDASQSAMRQQSSTGKEYVEDIDDTYMHIER